MSKKMLIVYYSISNGNTRRIAEQLQKATGADLAEIETVVPYTGTYNEIVDQGQREVNRGYKPELKPLSVDPEEYDIIAVGTPTWWYTMAPAVSVLPVKIQLERKNCHSISDPWRLAGSCYERHSDSLYRCKLCP